MKRLMFALVLSLALFGCSVAEVPTVTQTNGVQEPTSVLYLTQTQEDAKNVVAVSFAEVELHSEEEKEYCRKEISTWFKEMTDVEIPLAFSERSQKPDLNHYEQYLVDLSGKAVYRSEQMVSVIFQGMVNLKSAAHPMHVFFSINYDPNTLKTISFSDLHEVTNELYLAFSSEGEKAIREENGGAWPQGLGSFSEVFCSKDSFVKGLASDCPAHERVYYYYTEHETIGFSFSTEHALGGHREVTLPRSRLTPA